MLSRILPVILACPLLLSLMVRANDKPLFVFVGIPPQKFLAERILGNTARVTSMSGVSDDPESYEPGPAQLQALLGSDLLVPLGVPAESRWLRLIREQRPLMTVVDCCRQLMIRRDSDNYEDPHVWLDPVLSREIAAMMRDAFIRARPHNAKLYRFNYRRLADELEQLHAWIQTERNKRQGETFLVSHPAWGYFADRYDLKQIALEIEGREIGPRTMAERIRQARAHNIATVFIQKQHRSAAAIQLADELQADIVTLDPLAADHLANLKRTAERILASLGP